MSFLGEITKQHKLKHVETRVTHLIPADHSIDNLLYEVPLLHSRVYIGSMDAAHSLSQIEQHNITHVLVVAPDIEHKFSDRLVYEQVDIIDTESEDLTKYLKRCIEWMDHHLNESESHRVLVHCIAGASRSASVCLAYMMYKNRQEQLTLEQALQELKNVRKQVQPNRGFMKQLQQLQDSKFTLW